MKNPFKRKKEKFPKDATPRVLDDIKAEYAELRAKAGELQYQAFVTAEDLRLTNTRLIEVNNEAARRISLDKEAAAKAPTETSQQ